MPLYETKGHLTGTIAPENVSAAQAYLTEPNMADYLDEPLRGVVLFQQWQLDANGHDYKVIAVTNRELTEAELKLLADNTSGQNSDGHGEGFEQQDFAWDEDESYEENCGYCSGRGTVTEVDDGDITERDCDECDGAGVFGADGEGRMISFDWETNDCTYVRVRTLEES